MSLVTSEPAISTKSRLNKKNIPSLTSLRFFAAFTVILIHYRGMLYYPLLIDRIAVQGRTGVSFFFVLSGFILVYNYYDWFENNTRRFKSFLWARFARVYPMHFVMLLIFTPIILYFFANQPDAVQNVAGEAHLTPSLLVSSWFGTLILINDFIPRILFRSIWNGASWSISAEAFFYLILPLFITYVLKHFKTSQTLLKLILCLFLIQLILFLAVAAIYYSLSNGQALSSSSEGFSVGYHLPFLRMWEFLIGATCGAFFVRYKDAEATSVVVKALSNRRIRNAILAVVLALILVVTFVNSNVGFWIFDFDSLRWYVIYTPLFATLITTVAFGPSFLTSVLDNRWLVLLGEASYSLYMIQSLPVVILEIQQSDGNTLPQIDYILIILASVLASVGFFKFIEQPARLFLKDKLWGKKQLV